MDLVLKTKIVLKILKIDWANEDAVYCIRGEIIEYPQLHVSVCLTGFLLRQTLRKAARIAKIIIPINKAPATADKGLKIISSIIKGTGAFVIIWDA